LNDSYSAIAGSLLGAPEDDHADARGARLREETSEQVCGNARGGGARGCNRIFVDVDLVGDLPDADGTDDRPAIPD